MKIKMLLVVAFFTIFLSTAKANHDYICSYYTSECRNVNWEKNPDGSLKFREDGTNRGYGTRIHITRYGNTRVGCPSRQERFGNFLEGIETVPATYNCGYDYCGYECPSGYNWYDWDSYLCYRYIYKNRKIGGNYGTVDFWYYGGFKYGDVVTKTETCELVRYDNSPPDLNIVKEEIELERRVLSYSGSIPCDLSNGVDNPNCSSVTDGSGKVIGYTGSIPCDSSNGPSNPSYCAPNYEIIRGYRATATCVDDNSNIKPGKIGNSGCNLSTSVLGTVVKRVDESHIFRAVDNAGNVTEVDARGSGPARIVITCEQNNNCIPRNTERVTDSGGGSLCLDNDNPVAEITYSIKRCTNQDVVVTNRCISDRTCGCRASPEDKASLTIQSNSNGTLGILDKAGNLTDLPWEVNWIDKTIPRNLQFVTGNQKASRENFFMISVLDEAPFGLCNSAYLTYELTITGPENKVITGTVKYDQTPTRGILGLTRIGTYNFHLKVTDQAGNASVKNDIPSIRIFPGDLDAGQTTISVDSQGDRYADGSSFYTYTLYLKDEFGNPISGKKVDLVNQDCSDTSSCKTIRTNMVSDSGDDALLEFDYGALSDQDGKVIFKLKSLSPGVFDQVFKISMNKWNNDYNDTFEAQSITKVIPSLNSFKKPFTGVLKASKDDGYTWDDLPEIGTSLKYKLQVNGIPSVNSVSVTLSDFKNYIRVVDPANTTIEGLSNISGLSSRSPTFDLRINTSASATSLGVPGIKISDDSDKSPTAISYQLSGKEIKYYLAADDGPESRSVIKIENNGTRFMGVKIIGSLQGQGKQIITGQSSNFSDISASDARTTIRRNAYKYISSMTSGQVLNGVKYVVGDVVLSGTPSGYETLVVKDGNVIIKGNLDSPNGRLGIVVLRDNYDVNNGYLDKGNVYVTPEVKKINAIIYADGGFISADSSGRPYTVDSTSRTYELRNQLIMNGSLFTRNTIGGAILSGGYYVLPGKGKTNDFNKAMIYDLNYIRRGNSGWDSNGNGVLDNGEYKDPFVIKYNPIIQTNPPKLFEN